MRIESVAIKNYRQYYNFQINFNQKGDKSLYSIIARNGTGKSNFLNAITWCLYDDEPHLSVKNKALPTLSVKKIREMKFDEVTNISVEITLTVNDERVIVKRVKTAKKKDDVNEPVFYMDNLLDVSIFGDNSRAYQGDDATRYINRILPNNLTEYFFFDNEQMNKYFSDNKGASIKSSIHAISQISLLERIEERLASIENEYVKQIGKKQPDIELLRSKYEGTKSIRVETEENIEELKKQINLSKKIIKECDEYLSGIGNIKKLRVDEKEIKDLLTYQIDSHEQNKKEILKFIVKYNTLLRMYPNMYKLNSLIVSMEDKGKLPPLVDIAFLKRMLNENICLICGNENLGEDERKNIENLIEQIEIPNRVSHLLKGVSSDVTKILEETMNYESYKQELFKNKLAIEKQINYLRKKLEDVENEISKCANEKKANEKLELKKQHEISLDNNQQKLVSQETYLSTIIVRESDAQLDLNKAISKAQVSKKIVIYKDRTDQIKNQIKCIKEELIKDMREKICTETYEVFDSMIWKKNTYKSIVIDEDYNVDLLNEDGYSALGSCSAAERSLLALSFTLALHKVSGFDAPLVIDSPVGRVSDTNREEFANVLVKVSRNKEVILLFTPSEYSEEIKPLFNKECTQIYYINTVEDESETILEEGK